MVKFCERTDKFSFTWDQVAQAFWNRYPNPFSAHVRTEDVLERKIENGKLYSKRLLTKTVRIPCWGRTLTIANEPIIEESIVDPVNREITTYTWNIGYKSAMIEEKCLYRPSEDNRKHTEVERKAWVSSASRFYFSRAIESYVVRRFRTNINKTCQGLQYVLERMFPSPLLLENRIHAKMDNKDKFCEKAKKATELAKSKAAPLLAACSPNNQ